MSGEALNKAVEALMSPSKVRLYREDTHRGEWQTLPSVYHQLTTSGQWTGGNQGGGAFGSRPVISTGVVALLIEIRDTITEAANDYGRIITTTHTTTTTGCWCKPYQPCPGVRSTTRTERDIPAELRAIASTTPNELITYWVETIRRWTSQAKATLGLNPNRPQWARGVPCPDCKATNAYQQDDERIIRTPALAITWGAPEGETHDYHQDDDYKVRAVECRACGAAWWRGPDLDQLVTNMFNQRANKTGAA